MIGYFAARNRRITNALVKLEVPAESFFSDKSLNRYDFQNSPRTEFSLHPNANSPQANWLRGIVGNTTFGSPENLWLIGVDVREEATRERLQFLKEIPELKWLQLSGLNCKIENASLDSAFFSNLEHLAIGPNYSFAADCYLDDESLAFISRMPKLESVCVLGHFSPLGIKALLAKPTLEKATFLLTNFNGLGTEEEYREIARQWPAKKIVIIYSKYGVIDTESLNEPLE